MASKQMKKEKKKRLKQKQKEITLKNKELRKNNVEVLSSDNDKNNLSDNNKDRMELLDLHKEELPDIDDIVAYTGPRGYVLKALNKMVYELNNKTISDEDIQGIARLLIELAEKPNTMYKQLLKIANIKDNDPRLKSKTKIKANLNMTERALLKNRMQGILMEYGWKGFNESIDYSGIRLFFEMTYRLILAGLEEKKIRSIDLTVGYGDTIYELGVNYMGDSTQYNIGGKNYSIEELIGIKCSSDDSQYNINENNYITVHFNSLDNLYNTYAIYKNKYKDFSESSLYSLATASDMAKQYESREEGKDIISYNGIVLNYVGVLECELKKFMALKFNLKEIDLKLVDAINYLSKLNHPILSTQELIEDLHKVRKLRNKAAHGNFITYDEYSYVSNIISDFLLDQISIELSYIKLGI